jgi:signal transduction histidine kinase
MSTAVRTSSVLAGAADADDDVASIGAAERLLRSSLGSVKGAPRALKVAAGRARGLAAVGAGELGPALLLAELLPELCLDQHVEEERLRSLVDTTAELADTPRELLRLEVALCTLSGRALLSLPPDRAIEAALRLALVLAPVRQVSLWEVDEHGNANCCSHAGPFPSKRTAELANHVLDGQAGNQSNGLLVGVAIKLGEQPVAALMARPEAGGRPRCEALLRQVAPMLGVQLERRSLIQRAATSERQLTLASERMLSRLAFDLHDGPLQNVAGITGDIAALRRRLGEAVADSQLRLQLLGCVDDLEARLHAVDTELRDFAHSLESPSAPRLAFTHMVDAELRAFARRTDIRPGLDLEGDLDDLTDSQRIALWRIIQESLANAREHSGAREVRVRAVAAHDSLRVEITDDGRGFEVRQTLLDAARRGRLGLVSISERVRLLGGSCEIRSKPGGPTSICATLPRWRPQT